MLETSLPQDTSLLRIKFMTRAIVPGHSAERWSRQLPGQQQYWNSCHFLFDTEESDYDWLVVYHDIPKNRGALAVEELRCDPRKTLLITTEPSSITVYGRDYLRQFGVVLTSQEPWAMPHPKVLFGQPGLVWYYGYPLANGSVRTFDDLQAMPPPVKTKEVSTVCSIRQGRVTLHHQRFGFTQQLQAALPELDVFGQGVRPMSDKAEVIDPYRYHLTIENRFYPHHMTEKLPDIFLGYGVPFYYGCPNAEEYFPAESFVRVDINDLPRTRDIIRSTIANNEYQHRLPYVLEARRRVLEEYNLFAVIDRVVRQCEGEDIPEPVNGGRIMNRPTLRLKRPLAGVRSLTEKICIKSRHALRRA